MPFLDRRAAGRRRAWGRGPIILKLESLERRALMATSAASPLPDLANAALSVSTSVSDWNGTLEVSGKVTNQGNATETAPFQVALYASPVRGIDKYSVQIGEVSIPAGLAPGQSAAYQTSVQLPTTPIPDVSSSGGTLYVTAWVNSNQSAPESNYRNNKDLGPPYDSASVLIQAPTPADLVGTTLAVTPTNPTWGSTITVTAQITNKSAGASPQTQAILSLTPAGLTYGDSTTVGIGTITVPPMSGYQTINLVQNITLPAVEPSSITNYTNFGLTMTQDGDYAVNDLYPQTALAGGRIRPDPDHDHDQFDVHGHRRPAPRPGRRLRHRAIRHDQMGPVHPGLHSRAEYRAGCRRALPGLLPPHRSGRIDQRRDLPRPDRRHEPRRRRQ